MSKIGGIVIGRGMLEIYTVYKIEPTRSNYFDALMEEFYHVRSYDDQYVTWTTLR